MMKNKCNDRWESINDFSTRWIRQHVPCDLLHVFVKRNKMEKLESRRCGRSNSAVLSIRKTLDFFHVTDLWTWKTLCTLAFLQQIKGDWMYNTGTGTWNMELPKENSHKRAIKMSRLTATWQTPELIHRWFYLLAFNGINAEPEV